MARRRALMMPRERRISDLISLLPHQMAAELTLQPWPRELTSIGKSKVMRIEAWRDWMH
jgi:hypothetical protein